MNLYEMLAVRVGTAEARALADRLSAWHDAMVLHRRRATRDASSECCAGDCPCHVAPLYWREARRVFGDSASELAFLRHSAAPGRRAEPAVRDGALTGSA